MKTIYIIKTNISLDDDSIRQLLIAEDLLEPDNSFFVRKETQREMHEHREKEKLFVADDNTKDKVAIGTKHEKEQPAVPENIPDPADVANKNEDEVDVDGCTKETTADKKGESREKENEEVEDEGKLVIVTQGKII